MAASNQQTEKVDPVLYLLFIGMVFFTAVLIGVEYFFKDDGQVFQVVAGILTGFAGSFFTKLKTSPSHSTGGDDNRITLTAPVEPEGK